MWLWLLLQAAIKRIASRAIQDPLRLMNRLNPLNPGRRRQPPPFTRKICLIFPSIHGIIEGKHLYLSEALLYYGLFI